MANYPTWNKINSLHFKWTISKARNSYGYNVCTLYVDTEKVSRCNGGGYDMEGTCLGDWVAMKFEKELLKLDKTFYGLTFNDPNYKPSQECLEKEEKDLLTKLTGLARLQDFYKQSSKLPTEKHTIPIIDGACGFSSVTTILNAIGFELQFLDRKTNDTIYKLVQLERVKNL